MRTRHLLDGRRTAQGSIGRGPPCTMGPKRGIPEHPRLASEMSWGLAQSPGTCLGVQVATSAVHYRVMGHVGEGQPPTRLRSTV